MAGSDATESIEVNPRVCGGKPVIRGTRIPVTVILEQIAEGDSWDTILAGYPELTRDDIRAAVFCGKSYIEMTKITPSLVS